MVITCEYEKRNGWVQLKRIEFEIYIIKKRKLGLQFDIGFNRWNQF